MTESLYGPTLWSRIPEQAAAVGSRKAAVAYVRQRADERSMIRLEVQRHPR
jgi:hypothetical protein